MSNKKPLLLGLICLGTFSLFAVNYGYGQTYKESDMENVNMNFCNEGIDKLKTEDTIFIEGNEQKTLCLYVSNRGDKKMEFIYGFAKGGYSNGGERTCDADMGTGNTFSRLIPMTHTRDIIIEPLSYQTIEEKIVIPPGMSGMQIGCLSYKLREPEFKNVGGMFVLEIHRASNLNIVVGGESTAKSIVKILDLSGGVFSTNKKISAEVDKENNMKVKFALENQGNVSQKITITGKIYNALGFQKDFVIPTKNLAPSMTSEFIGDVGMLPLYKGLFTISFNITNEPQFDFPVTNEKLKQPGYVGEKTTIFIFSRAYIIAGIIILFILYKLLFHKKPRPVVVQS